MYVKRRIENAKQLICVISGGIGRNIFATGFIRELRKSYPDKKIFVVSSFPDVFIHNPNIDRLDSFVPQHLFEDFIFKKDDSLIIDVEPYRHPDYLAGKRHVVDCWCDMLDIPCGNILPEIFLSHNESEMAKAFVETLEKRHNAPIVLLQHVGGKISELGNKEVQIRDRGNMYRRSLIDKTAQELVDLLSKDGYHVGSVQSKQQFNPNNAELICFPIRSIVALLPHVAGVICVDSFLQHASAALNIPSLVLWAGTSPDCLGYSIHKNIRKKVCPTPECHRPNSYVFDVQMNGTIWDCPYGDKCTLYTGEEIYNAYKDMVGTKYGETLDKFKKDSVLSSSSKPEILCMCEKKVN